MTEPTVLARRRGALGHLTLNAPRSINALTTDMVRRLAAALAAWDADPDVAAIALDGAGDRGLCAGGDIRWVRERALAGDLAAPEEFWTEEYAVDAAIASATTPVVVLMDGIVMGGGVGLAGHARHRLVTETARVAMPEVGIGFTPDVGGDFLLTRAAHHLGDAIGLTGASVGPADALAAGLADAHLPAVAWGIVLDRLADGVPAQDATAGLTATPPPGVFDRAARETVERAYDAASVAEVLDGLARVPLLAEAITRASPLSMAVTFEALRRARGHTRLEETLAQDLHLAMRFARHPEFAEGVRAALVNKDRAPVWRHDDVRAVGGDEVAAFFA